MSKIVAGCRPVEYVDVIYNEKYDLSKICDLEPRPFLESGLLDALLPPQRGTGMQEAWMLHDLKRFLNRRGDLFVAITLLRVCDKLGFCAPCVCIEMYRKHCCNFNLQVFVFDIELHSLHVPALKTPPRAC